MASFWLIALWESPYWCKGTLFCALQLINFGIFCIQLKKGE